MHKLIMVPDRDGYTYDPGDSTISTKLDGGQSRRRADIDGATGIVKAVWNCSPEEYNYLMAFWRTYTNKGADKFLLDLLLDNAYLEEYECAFNEQPSLQNQKGLEFVVSASLEVTPHDVDEETDENYLLLYEISQGSPLYFINQVDYIANTLAPSTLHT